MRDDDDRLDSLREDGATRREQYRGRLTESLARLDDEIARTERYARKLRLHGLSVDEQRSRAVASTPSVDGRLTWRLRGSALEAAYLESTDPACHPNNELPGPAAASGRRGASSSPDRTPELQRPITAGAGNDGSNPSAPPGAFCHPVGAAADSQEAPHPPDSGGPSNAAAAPTDFFAAGTLEEALQLAVEVQPQGRVCGACCDYQALLGGADGAPCRIWPGTRRGVGDRACSWFRRR